MPGLDGMTLANRLLSMNQRAGVVFVTGYEKYAVEAFEAGALDYLLKPVSAERLQNTLWIISDYLNAADTDEAQL